MTARGYRPTDRRKSVPSILDRFRLEGKVAVVTGASSGLGVGFATGLASAGADIAICARRADRLRETQRAVHESGRRCVAVEADVSRPEDCRRVIEQAVTELGRVDVLINNAGVGTAVPALREPPEDFRRVIDVNLNGSYYMAQASAAAMRQSGGGSIVNIGSILGLTSAGLPQAAYSSSKAAIIGLTRDLAQQWTGRYGIRVNALAPGFFRSEMTDQYPDDYIEGRLERVPAGRVGEAEELVAAAVFLASDAASYITGIVLPVDGGTLTS
jgi:NAD(P)-dependent dehydrogenase (short-subunit alcohol dehydrogenase family)